MAGISRTILAVAVAAWMLGELASCEPPAASSAGPPPMPFLHGFHTAIVDEKGNPVILRGCNLGSWLLIEPWMLGILDNPAVHDHAQIYATLGRRFGTAQADELLDLYRENWITRRDFDLIKSWGFNAVRLPFHYGLIEDDAAPGEVRVDAFRWLDRAVSMARADGLYVILDLHGAPGGQSLDADTGQAGLNQLWRPENRARAAFIWGAVARHFRDEPAVAAYDLLNEPYGNGTNHDAALVGTMEELIAAVRQADSRHLIFCAGSPRGIEMYGSPKSRGWDNIGMTEHFYPGLFGNSAPSLETHARFIGCDVANRFALLNSWDVPYFVGEFNVVLEQAGGADMMRRYFDIFMSHGWAATLWSYKLIKPEAGYHPSPWYMVTNRDAVRLPDFAHDSLDQLSAFFRSLGTMPYEEDAPLREALTAQHAPPLPLESYTPVSIPVRLSALPGWMDTDVGEAFPRGAHTGTRDTVRVYGGGLGIRNEGDEFHFVSQPVASDFTLESGVTPPTPVTDEAKSGIMFRSSLASDSPTLFVQLSCHGQCVLGCRRSPGGPLTLDELRFDPGASTLRIVRHGAAFDCAALDAQGRLLASRSLALPQLPAAGRAGVFVLSRDMMQLGSAEFSHLVLDNPKPILTPIVTPKSP